MLSPARSTSMNSGMVSPSGASFDAVGFAVDPHCDLDSSTLPGGTVIDHPVGEFLDLSDNAETRRVDELYASIDLLL